MKLIIAGSRKANYSKTAILTELNKNGIYTTDIIEIVSGGADGIDKSGEIFASECTYPLKKFPADWAKHGRAAGPIRNRQMAQYADALLLIWDGKSPGSKSMKAEMTKLKKPVYEVIVSLPVMISLPRTYVNATRRSGADDIIIALNRQEARWAVQPTPPVNWDLINTIRDRINTTGNFPDIDIDEL